MLVLGSGFRKQGEREMSYYSMHVLLALDSKAATKRVLLYFLTQGSRSSSNAMPSCGRCLSFSLLVRDEALVLQSIAFGCRWVAEALDVASQPPLNSSGTGYGF